MKVCCVLRERSILQVHYYLSPANSEGFPQSDPYYWRAVYGCGRGGTELHPPRHRPLDRRCAESNVHFEGNANVNSENQCAHKRRCPEAASNDEKHLGPPYPACGHRSAAIGGAAFGRRYRFVCNGPSSHAGATDHARKRHDVLHIQARQVLVPEELGCRCCAQRRLRRD